MSDMSHDERDAEGRSRLDVEAAFADIVARWDDDSPAPVGSLAGAGGRRAADEPTCPTTRRPTDDTGTDVRSRRTTDRMSRSRRPAGRRARSCPTAEPEGYVPPEPPPLPRGDAIGWLAWIAVLGGPLFLFFASLWWTDVGRFWILLAVLAFIAGFAAIVARLPNNRSDDGPDDGAVV